MAEAGLIAHDFSLPVALALVDPNGTTSVMRYFGRDRAKTQATKRTGSYASLMSILVSPSRE